MKVVDMVIQFHLFIFFVVRFLSLQTATEKQNYNKEAKAITITTTLIQHIS